MQAAKKPQSWDPMWEDLFKSQAWGKYPPEELIRFVARNFYSVKERSQVDMLEVGCGAGACLWFITREGFSATGIDGASAALEKARDLLKKDNLNANLICGDIIQLDEIVGDKQFDFIYDVGCLQCNRVDQIKEIVSKSFKLLKPGGKIFSIMVSEDPSARKSGKEIEPNTFVDITEGCLAYRGLNHICTEAEIKELFSQFDNLEIDYTKRSFANQTLFYENWICTASKPIT